MHLEQSTWFLCSTGCLKIKINKESKQSTKHYAQKALKDWISRPAMDLELKIYIFRLRWI